MRKIPFLLILPLAWMLLASPPQAAAQAIHKGESDIVVTLPPLAGLVRMLKPDAGIACLFDAGGDPHHFRMRPHTVERMARARLMIRASRDDAGWPLPPRHANSLDLGADTSHVWLNPAALAQAWERLAGRLKQLYPAEAAAIDQRLQRAMAETERMRLAWQARLQGVDGVIMQHPSWLGMMRQMGIPVLAVLESGHHGDEASPRDLENALDLLRKHPHAWLLGDLAHSSRALDWLARHSQATRVTLDALGECDTNWLTLMQDNLARLPSVPDRP